MLKQLLMLMTPKTVQIGDFDGVKVLYNSNHGDPVRAMVRWSTDGSSWNTVLDTTDLQWASSEQTEKAGTWTAPGRKRYWCLELKDPADNNIGSQSDVILEVTWRQGGSYVTDKSGVTITNPDGWILGTLENTYDGSDATGTTELTPGAGQHPQLVFDFGA